VRAPKGDPHSPALLTTDEFEKLLETCASRPMLHLYVMLLGETSLRAFSEALQLRFEDVDVDGGFIQVRGGSDGHWTKSGKHRWVPLTPRLGIALRAHERRCRAAIYGGKRPVHIFQHTHATRQAKAGDRVKTFRNAFKAALARAQLRDIRLHDLRHRRVTCGSRKERASVSCRNRWALHADRHGRIRPPAREHLRALVDAKTPADTADVKAG
jgi:integrase